MLDCKIANLLVENTVVAVDVVVVIVVAAAAAVEKTKM